MTKRQRRAELFGFVFVAILVGLAAWGFTKL